MACMRNTKRKYKFRDAKRRHYGTKMLEVLATLGVDKAQKLYPTVDFDEVCREIQQAFEHDVFGEEWPE